MKNRNELSHYGIETSTGVFHAHSWSSELPTNFTKLMIENLLDSTLSKLRFCLHPSADELMQVTYLAFKAPYKDRVHKHPHRPEVVIPLFGEALHTTYASDGLVIAQRHLTENQPTGASTQPGDWHSMEILTPVFLMVEVGVGPLRPDSTVFFEY